MKKILRRGSPPAATYPCLFYGTATVDGQPVEAGTEITAWVGDQQVGSTLTGQGDLAPDQYTLEVELEPPAEVSFKIGELWANETATFVQYGAVEVNLTAESGAVNNPPSVTEPQPADQAIDVPTSAELSVLVSDPEEDVMTVTFYDASDDSVIGTVADVATGTRPSVTWDGLDYAAQYSWYVKVSDGVNPEVTSPTWSFTTVANNPPSVSDPLPPDLATDVSTSPQLSVLVSDLDGDLMTVTFYNAADDSVIDTATDVASGARASVSWTGLDYETQYSWYVKVSDGVNPEVTSPTWSFTTRAAPTAVELVEGVNIIPYNGATTALPAALTNIGPDGLDVVDIIWARGAWTNGQWLYYNPRVAFGNLTQLEEGRAYIIVVSQECTWEMP